MSSVRPAHTGNSTAHLQLHEAQPSCLDASLAGYKIQLLQQHCMHLGHGSTPLTNTSSALVPCCPRNEGPQPCCQALQASSQPQWAAATAAVTAAIAASRRRAAAGSSTSSGARQCERLCCCCALQAQQDLVGCEEAFRGGFLRARGRRRMQRRAHGVMESGGAGHRLFASSAT